MADVLDRIRKLLALSTSPNEHEAQAAALAAAKLIRTHEVVLSLPGASMPLPVPADPPPVANPTPGREKKVKDRFGREWTFHDFWVGGGNCTFCAAPCIRGHAIYSSRSGKLHLLCWSARQEGKTRPGGQPAQPTTPKSVINIGTEQAAGTDVKRAFDEFWEHLESSRRG